jgi:hypothetical protein
LANRPCTFQNFDFLDAIQGMGDATEPRSMSVAIGSEHPMECVDVRSIRRNRPGEATARLVLEEKDFVEPWRRLARNQRGTRQNDCDDTGGKGDAPGDGFVWHFERPFIKRPKRREEIIDGRYVRIPAFRCGGDITAL